MIGRTPPPAGIPPPPYDPEIDYDPSTAAEIALADALDRQDLAAGRDFAGPAPDCRRTRVPPGEARVAVLALRYDLRVGLFSCGDAMLGAVPPPPPSPPGLPRKRRPSELKRRPSYRVGDAVRKRAARIAAQRKRGGDAT